MTKDLFQSQVTAKTALPRRRHATTREIVEYLDNNLVRRRGAPIPSYLPMAKFNHDTKLKVSTKRFFRVLAEHGYINRSSLRGGFITGVAFRTE